MLTKFLRRGDASRFGSQFTKSIRPVSGSRSLSQVRSTSYRQESHYNYSWNIAAGVLAAGAVGLYFKDDLFAAPRVDYKAVRKDIEDLLDEDDYDDGSYGPLLVRLAWHASGTYSQFSKDGGSDGATMRFAPECNHGANAGLGVARKLLEKVKAKHPGISYADLWTLAGAVAIEAMGGPHIDWSPGRSDALNGSFCPPDGRLPDAARGEDHVRAIFYRMGFSDQEMVALIGAHALGRCHTDRSGFDGPWTYAPTSFTNQYFVLLLNEQWREKDWKGPRQFVNKDGSLMMLPADMALIQDANFKKYVELYAKDEDAFFRDFSAAFSRLLALGVN